MPYVPEDVDHTFYHTARTVQDTLKPSAEQRITLIVAGCYIIAIAILW